MELSDVAQKANKAAMRAELLNLARRSVRDWMASLCAKLSSNRQIERLAISKNLLPDEHPFASSQSELLSAASRNQVPIQATLAEALQSDDTFSELYGSLLLKTKDAFAEAGRGRMAVVLGHVLAAFYR